MVWFITQKIPVHLEHLEVRMRQTGHYMEKGPLELTDVQELLNRRIDTLDIEKAKGDILPFIEDRSRLDIWSHPFFHSLVSGLNGDRL